MSLNDREVKYLGARDGSHYFIERRDIKEYDGEGRLLNTTSQLRLLECVDRDDDQLYEYFTENYDYKDERIYQVNHNDEEESLKSFIDDVNDNWWDYVDSVIEPCQYQAIVNWYIENENEDYNDRNIEVYSSHNIQLDNKGEYNVWELKTIDEWDKEHLNIDARMEIEMFFGKGDYEYIKI